MLGPPHIRFYAGAPLIDSTGCRLGSLCVLDRAPRNFDAENCNVLCNFAEVVVREMEKDKLRVSGGRPGAVLSLQAGLPAGVSAAAWQRFRGCGAPPGGRSACSSSAQHRSADMQQRWLCGAGGGVMLRTRRLLLPAQGVSLFGVSCRRALCGSTRLLLHLLPAW